MPSRAFVPDPCCTKPHNHRFNIPCSFPLLSPQVQAAAERTRFIPEEITQKGYSSIRPKDLNRLTGDIFMQDRDLNLVNPIMDTPEWFEQQDDRLLQTYKKVVVAPRSRRPDGLASLPSCLWFCNPTLTEACQLTCSLHPAGLRIYGDGRPNYYRQQPPGMLAGSLGAASGATARLRWV